MNSCFSAQQLFCAHLFTCSNGSSPCCCSITANISTSFQASTSSSLLLSSISEVSLHPSLFFFLTISLASMSASLSPSQLSLLMESFFRVRRLNYCNGVSDTWDLRTNKEWGGWGGGKQRNIIMSFREKLWSMCVTESSQRLCRQTFFSSTFFVEHSIWLAFRV